MSTRIVVGNTAGEADPQRIYDQISDAARDSPDKGARFKAPGHAGLRLKDVKLFQTVKTFEGSRYNLDRMLDNMDLSDSQRSAIRDKWDKCAHKDLTWSNLKTSLESLNRPPNLEFVPIRSVGRSALQSNLSVLTTADNIIGHHANSVRLPNKTGYSVSKNLGGLTVNVTVGDGGLQNQGKLGYTDGRIRPWNMDKEGKYKGSHVVAVRHTGSLEGYGGTHSLASCNAAGAVMRDSHGNRKVVITHVNGRFDWDNMQNEVNNSTENGDTVDFLFATVKNSRIIRQFAVLCDVHDYSAQEGHEFLPIRLDTASDMWIDVDARNDPIDIRVGINSNTRPINEDNNLL